MLKTFLQLAKEIESIMREYDGATATNKVLEAKNIELKALANSVTRDPSLVNKLFSSRSEETRGIADVLIARELHSVLPNKTRQILVFYAFDSDDSKASMLAKSALVGLGLARPWPINKSYLMS